MIPDIVNETSVQNLRTTPAPKPPEVRIYPVDIRFEKRNMREELVIERAKNTVGAKEAYWIWHMCYHSTQRKGGLAGT